MDFTDLTPLIPRDLILMPSLRSVCYNTSLHLFKDDCFLS